MNDDPILWQIILQVILIALNAVFACAEIAVISMNDNKLAKMAEQGDKRAVRLARLTSQPARFLATIQVAITLSGFLGSAFAADNFSDKFVSWLIDLGVTIPVKTLDTISVILITLILSYFTLVLGELVPKRVAMRKAETLALGMSAFITFISKLFAPIVWFLTISTNAMLKLLRIDPNAKDDEVTEEEIRMMVDVGSEKGIIAPEEKQMIQNIFEFNDITVGEISTHRTEITALWNDETLEQWEQTIQKSQHSVYPVCGESIDDVIGILRAKDYFREKGKTLSEMLETIVKPAYFVPDSLRADILFRNMKQSRNHFAVVLDEYGGMTGIVTMNDLLEQLVGDLDDDISAEEITPEIESISETSWKINGSVSLDEVAEHLDLPIDEFETFSGYVFSHMSSIPADGSTFEIKIEPLHIQVTSVQEHRIEEAIISITTKEA